MSVQTSQNEPPQQPPSDQQINFERLRKQLEQERAMRQEAEKRVQDIERVAQERIKTETSDEDDDEPYVDHKKLNKKLTTFKKNIDDDIDKRVQEGARKMFEEEKRVSYLRENPDFQQVMSSDVVQKFADSHPRLAENILRMPEGFERQKLVYENIKALGLDKPKAKEPSIQEKIEANRRSPFSPAGGSQGPGYAPMGDFSEAGIKSNYDKMQELKKRLRL